jgi:hypothetical protein
MFNLFGAQGNTRGLGMTSSSVTTLDGHTGYFAAGTLQPFVTGVIPVVGEQRRFLSSQTIGPELAGPPMSTLQDRIARLESRGETLGAKRPASTTSQTPAEPPSPPASNTLAGDNSTATEPVDSIAAIRRQRQAAIDAANRAAAGHFAQAEGKHALAIYHYKIAERDGDKAIRQQARERLEALVVKGN